MVSTIVTFLQGNKIRPESKEKKKIIIIIIIIIIILK